MTALLDVNILLDVLLDRPPWNVDAKAVWKACDDGRLTGYVSAISLPVIFYIARKSAGIERARQSVRVCLDAFQVCPVDQVVLNEAWALPGSDFEDNVRIACATRAAVDVIVTRDPRGLTNPQVPVVSPAQLLPRL